MTSVSHVLGVCETWNLHTPVDDSEDIRIHLDWGELLVATKERAFSSQ